MADKPKTYTIAYNAERQRATAYPSWKGAQSGTVELRRYQPANPRANLEDYLPELRDEIIEAVVEYTAGTPIEIIISPLDGTKDRHLSSI